MSAHSPGVDIGWKIAAYEAGSAGHASIERVHLLIGLVSLEKALRPEASDLSPGPELEDALRRERAAVVEILAGSALDASELRRALRRRAGEGPGAPRGPLGRSPSAKAAFARAAELAGGGTAGALHLLAALLEEPDAAIRDVLVERRVAPEVLAARARAHAGDPARGGGAAAEAEPSPAAGASRPDTPMLDRYSRDLTRLARDGELGPVIGRRDELLRVLQTLARSSKSNPLLVGEAGVGKTAIVELLAIRAAAGKDPAVLGGVRLVELNLGALLGGTSYRGELEQRLTRILDEAASDPKLILFIDELHTVVGAGRVGSGGADAADLMKPALARGALRVIGATTIAEFRRHVESDAALERRFEKIDVPEPSPEESLRILEGLRERWERHHGVAIEAGALEAAVALSVRFDTDHRLPDKAVDLIDKAAARARVPMLSMIAPQAAVAGPASSAPIPVRARHVAEVLAEKRDLPLALVADAAGERDAARILELEPFLRSRLVGQQRVVARVAQRLRVAHAGLAGERGPLAVLLFLGPTGVGKTELARLLAEFLFGSPRDLVRFDMSEYMEEHAVAKLLGAPPGYKGYDDEGLLISRLRSRPHGVVLLDEVEKAHPRIFDVFLQVFDEGRVTDARGRTADARHAIFVLTSNLGASGTRARLGFGDVAGTPEEDLEREALEQARGFFRAELLNRIDEVLVFRPLGPEDVKRIAQQSLESLASEVAARHGIALRLSPDAAALVAREGFSAAYGARELDRAVERLVRAPLADLVLSGRLTRHRTWILQARGGGIALEPDPGG